MYLLALTILTRSWYNSYYAWSRFLDGPSGWRDLCNFGQYFMIFIRKKATVIENIGGSISDGLHYVHMIVLGAVMLHYSCFLWELAFGNIDKAILTNGWIMLVWQDTFPMHMFLLQTKLKVSQFYQHLLASITTKANVFPMI